MVNITPEVVMDENCQWLKDIDSSNRCGDNVNIGVYNLIVSTRDLKLFTKGIKPHRNWKLKDVKNYFGLRGDKHKILKSLQVLDKIINIPKIDR